MKVGGLKWKKNGITASTLLKINPTVDLFILWLTQRFGPKHDHGPIRVLKGPKVSLCDHVFLSVLPKDPMHRFRFWSLQYIGPKFGPRIEGPHSAEGSSKYTAG